jgi:hypothetical protein
MAVIHEPPIGVDLVLGSEGPRAPFRPILIQISEKVFYQILVSYAALVGTLHAYLSTDGGNTWVEQDAAHSPDPSNQCGFYYVFHDPAHFTIDVLYRTGDLVTLGPAIRVCQFNTVGAVSPNTWNAPGLAFDITTIPDNANEGKYGFYRQSGGGPWVVVSARLSFFPSVFRMYRLTYNGVAWTGPVDLTSDNTASDIWGGVLGPGDVYYFLADNGFSNLLLYALSSTFVLTGPFALPGPAFFTPSGGVISVPAIILFGPDSIAIAYTTTNGDDRVFIGTPRASPVFAMYIIRTLVNSESSIDSTLVIDRTGRLNVFSIVQDLTDVPNESFAYQSVFNGTSWSPPAVFYDEITNPPPGGFAEAFHKFDAIQLSTGWIATTAMGALGEENNVQFILLETCWPFSLNISPAGAYPQRRGERV